MDELDRSIIALLKNNARLPLALMARKLRVARSTVQARLERLENSGVIAGYTLRLGKENEQNQLRATVLLRIDPRAQTSLLQKLQSLPEIERALTISGDADLLLQIACPNTQHLDRILDQVRAMPGVRSSESLIHLSTKLDRLLVN